MLKNKNSFSNKLFHADNRYDPNSFCQGSLTIWEKGVYNCPYKHVPFAMQYKDYPKFIRQWRKAANAKGNRISWTYSMFNLQGLIK